MSGQFGTGQFGPGQFGPGQFGPRQFGPGQFGTRTIRYQDNSVPGQLIYILLRILFTGETQKKRQFVHFP